MFAHNQRLQRLVGGGFLERLWLDFISKVQLWGLGTHKSRNDVELVRRVRRERRSLMTANECYMLYKMAEALTNRPGPGDMAEVGVYEGCSAKLICEAKGNRALHLFDTFEGLPTATAPDGRVHQEQQYACSLQSVQSYLRDYQQVHYYKGRFQETACQAPQAVVYFFAHFDVDLYESTHACLDYFYPRMLPGGIMLFHDYSVLAGVKQAFQEFMADKPETPIEMPTTQCLVIKL
jgi:O-methyltransferase